jgi:hypothetical protein
MRRDYSLKLRSLGRSFDNEEQTQKMPFAVRLQIEIGFAAERIPRMATGSINA